MEKSENFVRRNFESELIEVQKRNSPKTLISIFEETLIYKYSEDGFESLNELLRKTKGKSNSEFGTHLISSLAKLPNYKGFAFRGVNLSKAELERYKRHLDSGRPLKEYAFISASKSRLISMAFRGNCLFRIWSKTGKSIEEYAKFGSGNSQNEQEVLFINNTSFKINGIIKEDGYILITMTEI